MGLQRYKWSLQELEDRHNVKFPHDKIKVIRREGSQVYFTSRYGEGKKQVGLFGKYNNSSRAFVDKMKFFIVKAKDIHGNKFDYSKVDYVNSKTNVTLVCKIHGEFQSTPSHHLQGVSCKKCSYLKMADGNTMSLEQYVEKARKTHGNKYIYDDSVYTGISNPITIRCPKHGEFTQKASNHTTGNGCQTCAKEGNSKITWGYTVWENFGNNSSSFDSFKVYIIKCYNDKEIFYKIGKTYKTLSERFPTTITMPYKYEVIKIETGNAQDISKLEKKLQRQNKKYKYLPKIKFSGMFECFSKIKKL